MQRRSIATLLAFTLLSGCAVRRGMRDASDAVDVDDVADEEPDQPDGQAGANGATRHALHGRLSYYAHQFAGRLTANGERFDPEELTMAHRTLPFGTRVRVVNLRNARSVIVRVNDRGPFVRGRVADISLAAARALDMLDHGVVRGRLEIVALGD